MSDPASNDARKGPPLGPLEFFIERQRHAPSNFKNDDLIGFLDQLTPRQIPVALRNQFKADSFALFFGAMFFLFGLGVFVLGCTLEFKSDAGPDAPVWAVPLVGCLIMLIGSIIYSIPKYFASRKLKLLSHGRLIDGTLTDIEPSPYVMGNDRVFEVRLKTSDGEKCKAYVKGAALDRADKLLDKKLNTPVLRDPLNPERVLVVECYTSD